jgi:hypothetical protein
MRADMKPDSMVKAELFKKIEECRGRSPLRPVKSRNAPAFLKWLPLTAAACLLVALSVLIFPHVMEQGGLQEPLPSENPFEPNSPDFRRFFGVVVQVYDHGELLVLTDEGIPYPHNELISVPFPGDMEFFVGDRIEVHYSGMIVESYPAAQVRAPHNILLIERDRRPGDYFAIEWSGMGYLQLPEFPDMYFSVIADELHMSYTDEEEQTFYLLMNVYGAESIFIADLTGDGYPEFIFVRNAEYDETSPTGEVTRVRHAFIYAYNYMIRDFSLLHFENSEVHLSLENGKIMVNLRGGTFVLAFINGQLALEDADRNLMMSDMEVISEPVEPIVFPQENVVISDTGVRITMPLYMYPGAYLHADSQYDGFITAVMPLPSDRNYPINAVLNQNDFFPSARWYNAGIEEPFYQGEITGDNVTDVSHVMFYGFTGSGLSRDFTKLDSIHGYEIYKFYYILNDFVREEIESGSSSGEHYEWLLNRRNYDYFIIDGSNFVKISFQPWRLENMDVFPIADREFESAMFDEMVQNILIQRSAPEDIVFSTALETPDGYVTGVLYPAHSVHAAEALLIAEMTYELMMLISEEPASSGANIFAGKTLSPGAVFNYRIDGFFEAENEPYYIKRLRVTVDLIFDDDSVKTEVAVEFVYVEGIIEDGSFISAPFGEGAYMVHDVYFVK